MSSTNRSTARENHIADYYVTPVPSIIDFLKASKDLILPTLHRDGYVLDPCAGGSADHEMSYPSALREALNIPGIGTPSIYTMDLREDSKAQKIADYLTFDFKQNHMPVPCMIITNPPFNLAQAIIEKALTDVQEGGLVIMLLRLNFFGSKGRAPFWKANMPIRAYIHSQRMKFTNTGGTDSIEYMHCVWQKGRKVEYTELKII